jgi:amidase
MERTPTWTAALHPDCVAAVRDAAKLLESLGHRVEARHPVAIDDERLPRTLLSIITAQTAALFELFEGMIGRPVTANDFELWTWTLGERGRRQPMLDFLGAVEWRNTLSRSFGEYYESGFDLLLTPTLAQPPLPLGALNPEPANPLGAWEKLVGFIPFTPVQNLTGEPAISLPLHWSASGLPIGVQLVAPWGREDVLIRIAAQLEQARPWRDRRPPVRA